MFTKLIRDRKGQGMVEYGLLLTGVCLVSVVAVSMLGHKTQDLIGTAAAVLPGTHDDDNGPIQGGQLVETDRAADGTIQMDTSATTGVASQTRGTGQNLFGEDTSALIK